MINASFQPGELRAISGARYEEGFAKAISRARSTSARDMKSEASKRIRARKTIRVKATNEAMSVTIKGRTLADMEWGVKVRGDTTRLIDYRPRPVIKGVSVSVNKGTRTLLEGAFIARMPHPRGKNKKGHLGVFMRRGRSRNPIYELVASRPIDALNHEGEAEGVMTRGRVSFIKTMRRVIDMSRSW
ncbi:MAG: hypothetical protein GY811_23390 [Myxococcales bacterium]|nr:hypothetical protein [Myxococcales bacterium]